MQDSINLLSTTSRVETPFIKVTIGKYTFGVHDKYSKNKSNNNLYNAFRINKIDYPDYVQDLKVIKINGAVNKYNLTLVYPITEDDDPNFFEKVFSSVSDSRKIVFSYGDLSLPTFCYREEEAIITDVKQSFSIASSSITYTISAISSGNLLRAGSYVFREKRAKPSDEIKKLINNNVCGLKEVFYGMENKDIVNKLVSSDDSEVNLKMKSNVSVIEYLNYLVDCMVPYNSGNSLKKKSVYLLTYHDGVNKSETTGKGDIEPFIVGPYFEVVKSEQVKEMPTAYQIDIGFPSQNVVTDFRVEKDENYSIYYNFLNSREEDNYVQRIDDKGNIINVYAPIISSRNSERITSENEMTWWSKVTEYPIKVSITLKGLLRPAILMTHVRLNVYFFGKKHISSGLYIITKQEDSISSKGFITTLNMVRIGKDE